MSLRPFWGWLFAVVTCFFSLTTQAQTAPTGALQGGPMVGGVSPTSAMIWLHATAAGPFRVEARDSAAHLTVAAQTDPMAADSIVVLRLDQLRPNTRYSYQIRQAHQAMVVGTGHFRTAPADSAQATDFTFALGSCAFIHAPYRPEGYSIFQRIHEQKPDLMLWLGDNVYLWGGEWNDPAAATRRYAYTRRTPEMQPLLADAAQFAIWDDHDFGPNDADGTLPTKDAMLAIFRRFWPHALYEAPTGSATGHFRWGDTEFFLLDDRAWRTPLKGTARRARTQLGAAQRAWLLQGLAKSTATFKFIAVGGQFLSPNARGETFANGFNRERKRLLHALDSTQIRNVVFLTGDRHFAELSRREERGVPTLYDLTASPLTAGPAKPRGRNRYRVAGTLIRGFNFATVRVSGLRGARQLTLTGFDEAGQARWQHTVRAE
jgi:alkaline phosphatase D